MQLNRSKTIRNLSIFTVIALGIGWIGVMVDRILPEQVGEETLGMAIWLITPLIVVIVLRSFFGDDWKDAGLKPNFKGNIQWYFIAFLIFPMVTGITLILGALVGWIGFEAFNAQPYFRTFFCLLMVNILKNIFEESVWRGYLTTKLFRLNVSDLWLYLIVGLVWGFWHFPYYLAFLPDEAIQSVLPVGRMTFAWIAVLNMLAWTVMFVEIFLITRSVWSVVLLHAVEDALINHLVIDGFI
uniref:CPBP family intramembrane glutamic endopeptidase n=1 Tax=Pararhodonellum marinum TaxID=2755358 RepID=UPI0018904217